MSDQNQQQAATDASTANNGKKNNLEQSTAAGTLASQPIKTLQIKPSDDTPFEQPFISTFLAAPTRGSVEPLERFRILNLLKLPNTENKYMVKLYSIRNNTITLESKMAVDYTGALGTTSFYEANQNSVFLSNKLKIGLDKSSRTLEGFSTLDFKGAELTLAQRCTKSITNSDASDIRTRIVLYSDAKKLPSGEKNPDYLHLAWMNPKKSQQKVTKIFDLRDYLVKIAQSCQGIEAGLYAEVGGLDFKEFDFLENPKKSPRFKLFVFTCTELGFITLTLFNLRTRRIVKQTKLDSLDVKNMIHFNIQHGSQTPTNMIDLPFKIYCPKRRTLFISLNMNLDDQTESAIIKIADILSPETSGMLYPPINEGHEWIFGNITKFGIFDHDRIYYVTNDRPNYCSFVNRVSLSMEDDEGGIEFSVQKLFEKELVEFIDIEHVLYQGDITLNLYSIKEDKILSKLKYCQNTQGQKSIFFEDIVVSWETDCEYHTLSKIVDGKLEQVSEFYLSQIIDRQFSFRGALYLGKDTENPFQYILFTLIEDMEEYYKTTMMKQQYFVTIILNKDLKIVEYKLQKRNRMVSLFDMKFPLPVKGTNLVLYCHKMAYDEDNSSIFQLFDIKACSQVNHAVVKTNGELVFLARGYGKNTFVGLDLVFPEGHQLVYNNENTEPIFLDPKENKRIKFVVITVNTKARTIEQKHMQVNFDFTPYLRKEILPGRLEEFGCFFIARNEEKSQIEVHFYNEQINQVDRVVLIKDSELYNRTWSEKTCTRMLSEHRMLIGNFQGSEDYYLIDMKDCRLGMVTKAGSRLTSSLLKASEQIFGRNYLVHGNSMAVAKLD